MKREIKFDYAKIRREFGKLWLFLGDYKHTRDDKTSVWIDERGHVKNWSYIDWKIVASGETWEKFMESIEVYLELCEMTMEEFIKELMEGKDEKIAHYFS